MADPEPKATPATTVEVADKGDVMILSDDDFNLLTQLATKLDELEKTVNEQQKIVDEQQKVIQKLVEQQQQSLTGHNQGASQIAEDDDAKEN